MAESWKETFVRDEMSKFLSSNGILSDDDWSIDDVLIEYVVNILNDFVDSSNKNRCKDDELRECLDVESLSETMTAYLPGLANLDRCAVQDWIFDLLERLRHVGEIQFCKAGQGSASIEEPSKANLWNFARVRSESEGAPKLDKKRHRSLDEECKAGILQRFAYTRERGEGDSQTSTTRSLSIPTTAKSVEPKKTVRYLDGKVVTTRGERYVEIKKDDEDDKAPKGTWLKAARKYRFH